MNASIVRVTNITIQNFKNVENGSLSLENPRKDYKASIVGIYGQNGSGKTSIIEAFDLLKYVLCGWSIPKEFADHISIGAAKATLAFEFRVLLPSGPQSVTYQFSIKKTVDESNQNASSSNLIEHKVVVCDELIKCPILTDGRIKMGRLIDTNSADGFNPVSKRKLLTGGKKIVETDLLVANKLASASSRSFIFSRELLDIIRSNVKTLKKEGVLPEDLLFYYSLIESLVAFGNTGLFVVRTAHTGLISLNAQPLLFKIQDGQQAFQGIITLPLDSPFDIEKEDRIVVEKIIFNMDTVLSQLIPGLTIKVRNLGSLVLQNGKEGSRIQLMSHRDNKEIPLKYESEGIKKIISILQLLIVVYNQPSITVAVDELDAGVFEYLLGELLRIIAEKGKGQLIFTSHNLRPLETLDRGFIAFTTTNPKNRYIRMEYVKDNNNLRDFYYRDIMLGEQDEELYEPTHNAEIALAFREAGEISGS